jgi:CRISPR-associated protein Cas5a/b/c
MLEIRAFYAKVLTTWGFVVRHKGTSAAQPSYPVPTPTTVVGAFGYPLLRLLEIPVSTGRKTKWGDGVLITEPMKALLESTLAASAGFTSSLNKKETSGRLVKTGLATYQEPNRIIAAPYRTGGQMENIRKARPFSPEFVNAMQLILPVQAVGATYAPYIALELLWVVDAKKLVKELGISLEKLDNIAQKAVYGVVRVGSKESLVALEDARYAKDVKVHRAGERIKTKLYVLSSCTERIVGTAEELIIPDLEYRPSNFYIPAEIASSNLIIPLHEDAPPPEFKVLHPCVAYSIDRGIAGVGVTYER